MNPTRVLFVSSATDLFLPTPPLSTHVQELSDYISFETDCETRLLLPRFGVIKERPNNIHETIRLSGINIPMGKDRISLVVKVPSRRDVKTSTYFVDSEELFQRKGVFTDAQGNFYPDNAIRALFFCKSVLAIIEKLSWIPHVIHCHGWMTAFVPLYLRKAYTETHPLKHTKSIYTLYEDTFEPTFPKDIIKHARYKQLKTSDFEDILPDTIGYQDLTSLAIHHADKVTRTFEAPQSPLWDTIPYQDVDYLPCERESLTTYLNLYENIRAK